MGYQTRMASKPTAAEAPADLDPLRDPALYFNRELSQLDFNFRVLAQAQDPSVPLLERLRYLCISCTNLAFHPQRAELYITLSDRGEVLRAAVPVAGKRMASHA